MKSEIKYVEEYYNNYNEDERLLNKRGKIEYLTTMKYIEKYIKPNDRILEVGAGTGRYSIALAEKGYEIDAVELVESNFKVLQSKIRDDMRINAYQGNAVNLNFIGDNQYDIVLVLGPMYHLFTDEDKHSAISEALRVTKKNGIVFIAYCNNDTSILRLFYNREFVDKYEKGLITEDFHRISGIEDVFEIYRKEDVDRIMRNFNVTRMHYVGVDMLSMFFRDSINNFTDEEFDLHMKYNYQICEREDMVGLSFHMLDIFRKE